MPFLNDRDLAASLHQNTSKLGKPWVASSVFFSDLSYPPWADFAMENQKENQQKGPIPH